MESGTVASESERPRRLALPPWRGGGGSRGANRSLNLKSVATTFAISLKSGCLHQYVELDVSSCVSESSVPSVIAHVLPCTWDLKLLAFDLIGCPMPFDCD